MIGQAPKKMRCLRSVTELWLSAVAPSGLVVACVAATVLLTGHSSAADWEVNATLDQEFFLEENRTLLEDSPGVSYGFATTPGLRLTGQTRRLLFEIGGDMTYKALTGSAEDEIDDDQNQFNQSADTALLWTWLKGAVGAEADFQRADVSTTELQDTGIVDVDSTRKQYGVGGTLSLKPTKLDQFGFGVNYTNVDFTKDPEGLNPYDAYSASATWSRPLSNVTVGSLSLQGTLFESDGGDENESEDVSFLASISTQVNTRLSIDVGLGVSYTNIEKNALSGGGRISDDQFGFIGDLGLTYIWEASQIAFGVSQSLEPSGVGELVERTTLSAKYDQDINNRMAWFFDVGARRDNSTGDFAENQNEERRFLTVEPGLTYKVTEDLYLVGSYRFRYQDFEGGGDATSNGVFLKFTYQHPL